MHYALPTKQKYPIETEEQVKTASVYFGKYISNFSPVDKSVITGCLEKRASDLGVKIDLPWAHNYEPKATYTQDFDHFIGMRKQASVNKTVAINGKTYPASAMLDKIANLKQSVPPTKMIELLTEFDKKANLVCMYDRTIRDPISTVYGSIMKPIEKFAEGLNSDDLIAASSNKQVLQKLASTFGKSMADDFAKNPVDVYESMPSPEKSAIADAIK